MLGAAILAMVSVLLIGPKYSEGQTLTPKNPLCGTFKSNAMKTFGSTCWAKGSNSYLGSGQKKKHVFLKYVVETSGGRMPFRDELPYESVLSMWRTCTPQAEWEPVTGAAQIGDVVVSDYHMGMVIKLGQLSMIVEDGRLLSRGTAAEINVRNMVHASYNWKVCTDDASASDYHIQHVVPSGPDGKCASYSWMEDTAKVAWIEGRTVLNWHVARAARTKVDVFYPAFSMKDQICVYRYVPTVIFTPAAPACVCFGAGTNEILERPCEAPLRNEQPNICAKTVSEKGKCIATNKMYYRLDAPVPCFVEDADFTVQADDVPCDFVSECKCIFSTYKPVFSAACGAQTDQVRSTCYKTIGPDETCGSPAETYVKIAFGPSGGYMKATDVNDSDMGYCELSG